MKSLSNQEVLNNIYLNIPLLTDKITNGFNKFYYYREFFKYERYEEIPNEKEEDAIKRAEGIYGRLDEMLKRNELSNKKAIETIELLNKMIDLFNGVVRNTEKESEELAIKNNESIDKIIELEQRRMNKLLKQNPKRKKEFEDVFEDKKSKWNMKRIRTIEMEKFEEKKVSKEKYYENTTRSFIDYEETKQIEEWTQMKIGNIIFDSNIDNWNYGTSVFDQKIINKSYLIFLIEDGDGNLFGGYINATIKKVKYITDPKSFVFSLRSNGRLNGIMKFNLKKASDGAFCFCEKSNENLFEFGRWDGFSDICVFKENKKDQSYCKQKYFNYNEIGNALCGRSEKNNPFTPKRVVVLQLI